MDPPLSYRSLQEHLSALVTDAPPELDVRLIEGFTAQLTDSNIPPLIPTLLPLISAALQHLRTDPTPLTALLLRLVAPVTFSDLHPDPQQILATLDAPSSPIQNLGIQIVRKAAGSAAETGIPAAWPQVTRRLVQLALVAEDTSVAEAAKEAIAELLTTDSAKNGGVGLLWRRLFGDDAVYREFFSLTSWDGEHLGGAKRKTEAQGRLLGLLEALAPIDWDVFERAQSEEVERQFVNKTTSDEPYGGLLLYAATKMVKDREDVMLHLVLLDFYRRLLETGSRKAWDFLTATGKVDHCLTLAVDPSKWTGEIFEHHILQSKASEFAASLCSTFPQELEKPLLSGAQKPLGSLLVGMINFYLDDARSGPHMPSLSIISALPAKYREAIAVEKIPLSPPSHEFLSTLATTLPADQALFSRYISVHPQLWETLAKYASTPAHGSVALDALELIARLAELDVEKVLGGPGVATMLVEIPAGFTSARAVAGADSEGWGWKVAHRRWEVAGIVAGKAGVGSPWKEALERRVRNDVFGKGTVAGSGVATMEA